MIEHMSDPVKPLRAALYTRVSVDDVAKGHMTKEEKGEAASVSINAQLKAGLKLIEHEKYALVAGGKLVDDGVSGWKAKGERASFAKLHELVRTGKIDVIVTRAIDRLGRNDNENSLIRLACADQGVIFQTFDGNKMDPRKGADKFQLQIYQSVAELQSSLKSETARNVTEERRMTGELRNSKKTFGWKWEKGNRKASMKKDETEAAAIEKAYADLLDKDKTKRKTLGQIRDEWNGTFPTVGKASQWTITSVRTVLLRPANAGFVRMGRSFDYYTEPEVRGKWDKITDEKTYLEARAFLTSASRRTNAGAKPKHLVSNIARCGVCGDVLLSSSAQGATKGERVSVYRCRSKTHKNKVEDVGVRHVSARCAELDKMTRDKIISAFFLVGDKFNEEGAADASALYDELDRIKAARTEVMAGIPELYKLADVSGRLRELKDEEQALERQVVETEAAKHTGLQDLRRGVFSSRTVEWSKAVEYRKALGEKFDALPLEERRNLVRYFWEITVLPLGPGMIGPKRWLFEPKVDAVRDALMDDDDTWDGSDPHEEETGFVVRFTEGGNYRSV